MCAATAACSAPSATTRATPTPTRCRVDEVVEKARETLAVGGISEIHIVGGEHPDLPFDYYLDMMRALRELAPDVHIQAFTASEIAHFARISGQSRAPRCCSELKDAGLGSLPGGGAEVFSGRVRDLICERKISGQTVARRARAPRTRSGIKSNATMLYGHVETPEELADHMVRLRELQDDTGGFNAFIPLSFQPANTGLSELPGPTGFDDLKMLAVGRLVLDNFRARQGVLDQRRPQAGAGLARRSASTTSTAPWWRRRSATRPASTRARSSARPSWCA